MIPLPLTEIREILNEAENRLSMLLNKRVSIQVYENMDEATPMYILCSVCAVLHVSVTDVFKKSRKGNLPDARFITAWYLFFEYGMRKTQIAAFLQVDHTSIIHGINRVIDRLKVKDEITLHTIQGINKYLNINQDANN